MNLTKNLDIIIAITLSLIGVASTCYLWSFVNGGNHWQLFGTSVERFLMQHDFALVLFFSGVLVLPLLVKRDRKRWVIALFSIPVFLFLYRSVFIFLD